MAPIISLFCMVVAVFSLDDKKCTQLVPQECVSSFIDSDGSGPYHRCTTNRDEHGQCWCSFDKHYVSGTGRWRYCDEDEHQTDRKKHPKNDVDVRHLKEMKNRHNEHKNADGIKHEKQQKLKHILGSKKRENIVGKRENAKSKQHDIFSEAMPSFMRAYQKLKKAEERHSKLLALPPDKQFEKMINNPPQPDIPLPF